MRDHEAPTAEDILGACEHEAANRGVLAAVGDHVRLGEYRRVSSDPEGPREFVWHEAVTGHGSQPPAEDWATLEEVLRADNVGVCADGSEVDLDRADVDRHDRTEQVRYHARRTRRGSGPKR